MTRLLLALALLAVTARLLRRRRPVDDLSERIRMAVEMENDADDSEVVGMPTMWEHPRLGVFEMYRGAVPGTGPGWYVELAPTSRN